MKHKPPHKPAMHKPGGAMAKPGKPMPPKKPKY